VAVSKPLLKADGIYPFGAGSGGSVAIHVILEEMINESNG
jgi:hypothetical protein